MTAHIDAAADTDVTDIDVTDTHSTADQTGHVSDVCGGTGGRLLLHRSLHTHGQSDVS